MNDNISWKSIPIFAAEHQLKVGGVVPFSATDYPGKFSTVVFVQGCPWRCGYCHNTHLQPRLAIPPVGWDEVKALLARRTGLIDAVVFSGGEPTIDPELIDAVLEVRMMGYEVGLHTAGIYPARLADVLPYLSWVGIDIKAPFDQYERVTRVKDSGKQARLAAEAVIASGVDHEFRTTVHPSLLSSRDIEVLGETLAGMGVRKYVLQRFRAQGCQDEELNDIVVSNYPDEGVSRRLASFFPYFSVRGA